MKPQVTVTWFGHSAFQYISAGGKSILIDPWFDNPKAPPGIKETIPADLILVTHGHSDHLSNVPEIARRTGATVFSIFEIALFLKSQGIEKSTGFNKGGSLIFENIKVTMVDAIHSSDIDVDGKVIPGGQSAGYILTFENGLKVYDSGDTALFSDMKLIGSLFKPDVAILPMGGFFTMGPREAALAASWIKPKIIIPKHYATFPALSGTPAEMKKFLPSPLKKRMLELEVGKPATLKK